MKTTYLLIATVTLLASCNKEEAVTTTTTASASSISPALSKVLDASPTGEVKAIHIIRNTAKSGDKITVSGKIMGNAEPFVDGRSVFILGDPEVLTACNENPDDACETPWDACCDSKEDKKRGIASIQIVDADGRVLKESVEGVGGIAKLADVTVSGTVAEGSSADVLIINAEAIHTGE